MILHDKQMEAVLQQLSTDPKMGLRQEEVAARQAQYGLNKLREKKKKTTS